MSLSRSDAPGIRCTKCQHDNPPSAKFCHECGTGLPRRCPSCQADLAPTMKFCGECGTEIKGLGVKGLAATGKTEPLTPNPVTPSPLSYTPKHLADKILQSKSALEGERKQVTVLFADVKGSMELAEQLDPGAVARDPRSLLRHPHRRRAPLRGHGEPVHRRRHHGAVRRADRARGPRAARLLRGAAPARRDRPLRHRGEARARRRLLDAHGHQLGRRSWSAGSATTCAWTTRRRATRSASRSAWKRSPRPTPAT